MAIRKIKKKSTGGNRRTSKGGGAAAKAVARKRTANRAKTSAKTTPTRAKRTAAAKTVRRAAPKRGTKARSRPARATRRGGQPNGAQVFGLVSRLVARALAVRLAPKGIGYGQFPVLVCLWEEDGVTQKVLSQRVRIEAPTMVRTLDRMERESLVRRVRSKTDRRQIHIRLTRKGANLERTLMPLAGEINEVALAGISKKDRRQLNDLLARLIVNLESDAQAFR